MIVNRFLVKRLKFRKLITQTSMELLNRIRIENLCVELWLHFVFRQFIIYSKKPSSIVFVPIPPCFSWINHRDLLHRSPGFSAKNQTRCRCRLRCSGLKDLIFRYDVIVCYADFIRVTILTFVHICVFVKNNISNVSGNFSFNLNTSKTKLFNIFDDIVIIKLKKINCKIFSASIFVLLQKVLDNFISFAKCTFLFSSLKFVR